MKVISRRKNKFFNSGMDAVFELLRQSPQDSRIILAAVGVAKTERKWLQLLEILSEGKLLFDVTSRTYIEGITKCIESTDVTVWPMKRLEYILITCLPRWGALISKDSLASLFGLVSAMVRHGLCIRQSNDPVIGRVSVFKPELLRILWYSSALSTILSALKTTVGDEEDRVSNVLLKHNSDLEKDSQAVIAAQEKALDCLAGLLEAALDPRLEQLASYLKQSSQDTLDSSSLPVVVSVAGILAGIGGVKVRPETVDAAANCLAGFIELCELSPSVFTSRVKTLRTQLVNAAVEGVKLRKSEKCVRLLHVMVKRLPSVVLQSEEFLAAIQTEQELYPCVTAFESVTGIKDTETEALTSGRAIVLSRLSDSTKAAKFLEKSLGNPEWLNETLVLDKPTVKTLANFYSFLQSMRIKGDVVVHEPTLVHMVRTARSVLYGSLEDMGIDFEEVERGLKKRDSHLSLMQSFKLLLMSQTKTVCETDLCERIKLSLLSVVAKLDVDVIRECPRIVSALLEILELCLEALVNSTGLKVKSSQSSSKEGRAILVKLLMDSLEFAKDKDHLNVIDAAFRCLPFFVVTASDITEDSDSISTLLDHIRTTLSPSIALTAIPSVLSALEAIVQSLSSSFDSTTRSRVLEYMVEIVAEASRTSGVIQKHVWVHLLSFVSSTLIVIGPDARVAGVAWILLSSHVAIQEAAAAASWDAAKLKYSTNHLIWVQALNLAIVLMSLGLVEGSSRFFSVHSEVMAETFTTAHTSDLATLEEACLISRLYELNGNSHPLPSPFQFTSLVTFKPPSVYPKSRAEKLAGNLADLYEEDVRSPCQVPSVFAQRVVWVASDILSTSLRRISRSQVDDSNLFHSLLDCSHFVLQYLSEVGTHKARVLRTVSVDQNGVYVPLSVQLSVDGRQLTSSAPPQRRSVGGSLLSSMSSPPVGASKNPPGPASLMDSLTPKNSPKNKDGGSGSAESELKFLPPLPGDCPLRTGLSFVAPALMTEDDFLGKLVDVLSLCLVQATRMASTESTMRPLLDLLLTTKSNGPKLPADAYDIVSQIIEVLTPRYNQLTHQQKVTQQSQVSPQLQPSLPQLETHHPLGYAAISNIR